MIAGVSARRYLVVGGGLAGGRAAETLARRCGPGEVTLIGSEPVLPYLRPMVSKELLLGGDEVAPWLHPESFWPDAGVRVHLDARAVALDPGGRSVALHSGEQVSFEKLLICTGATPVPLRVPGDHLAGICYVRTLADAARLRPLLRPGRRCEVAAACRARGADGVMLEAAPAPCAGSLGAEVGDWLGGVHREYGVDLRTETTVRAFRGDGDGNVAEVETSDGRVEPCDVAVVGVGVRPATEWLDGSGLDVDDGILVDEYCESSVAGVYAAGDVARWRHPHLGRRLRVEHETNAQTQAAVAARNMAGARRAFAPVPYVWSRQYDLDLWALGDLERRPRSVEVRTEHRRLLAVYRDGDGVVSAVVGVNRPDDIEAARRAVRTRAQELLLNGRNG